MCLSCISDNMEERKQLKDFAEWVLCIGDGKIALDDGEKLIQIPNDILLQGGDDPKQTIINNTYPDLLHNYRQRSFLQERAILCPRNKIVQEINDYIMEEMILSKVRW
jgi:ATP-dependent DNA helicase PIF1